MRNGILVMRAGLIFIMAAAAYGASWREPLVGTAPTKIIVQMKSKMGIARILVRVKVGEMVCLDSVESGVIRGNPSFRDSMEYEVECLFEDPVTSGHVANCPFSVDFRDRYKNKNVLVSYQAMAKDGSKVVKEEEVTFAQGRPPSPNCLWPVFWHRESTFTDKLDLAFMPNADYDIDNHSYDVFAENASDLLGSTFFDRRPFSAVYFDSRDRFNLWLAPQGAEAKGCLRSFSRNLQWLLWRMDGRIILHQKNFQDCAEISLGGSGSVYYKNPSILVHESGHFLFGLADEYPCNGTYGTAGKCKNVFSGRDECRGYASSIDSDGKFCREIFCDDSGKSNAWRMNDQDGDQELSIMARLSRAADWRLAAQQCVLERLGK